MCAKFHKYLSMVLASKYNKHTNTNSQSLVYIILVRVKVYTLAKGELAKAAGLSVGLNSGGDPPITSHLPYNMAAILNVMAMILNMEPMVILSKLNIFACLFPLILILYVVNTSYTKQKPWNYF